MNAETSTQARRAPSRETPEQRKARTRPAIAAHKQYAAVRALDDPAALDRAARIIRLALARNRLTMADLAEQPDGAA